MYISLFNQRLNSSTLARDCDHFIYTNECRQSHKSDYIKRFCPCHESYS